MFSGGLQERRSFPAESWVVVAWRSRGADGRPNEHRSGKIWDIRNREEENQGKENVEDSVLT